MFCLPIEQVNKFKKALIEGVVDPAKLGDMTSAERHTFFSKLIGEADARDVNALFESKLLLKNQQQGMINWAKTVVGMKESVRRDIIAKIEKMDKILDAKSEKAFLEDLASTKLGTEVIFEEAKQISELSKKLTEAKANLNESNRLDYGAKRVTLENYVNELKLTNKESSIKETLGNLKKNPLGGTTQAISDLAGFAKGVKASLDDSAIFRQGWKTVFTNPLIWTNRAVESFGNIIKQLSRKATNDDVMNGIKADIYSRPNAIDGSYNKMKLDIGMGEEAFPTSLPQKIPIFGRLYKASQTAYEGFLYRMRADIADKYVKIAKENGVDLTDPLQLESIGRLTNSLTGRGNLGSFEKVGKQINTIFFSPKMVKSSFDFLTLHASDKMSGFARKQAAINLLKVTTGIATILGVAKALNPDSVDLDTRSADFGKIKIGDTRFDVSGGMSSMITLAARLITGQSKSSTTGKITELNSGKFGSQTKVDVFENYFLNKLSPAASVVKDLMQGQDFDGNKPTLLRESKNLLVPLPITNAIEILKAPNGANPLLTIIADALGISTNTYAPKKK